MDSRTLRSLSDDVLLGRLSDLVRLSRRSEADLVAHIAEVDARRLYAREASPSMFACCTERLHLSEAEAYLRIAAARASRQYPLLLEGLADGRLHLAGIARLAPHLTPDNAFALLQRAEHKTRREIEELVAGLAPRPDARAVLRRLPEPRVQGVGTGGSQPSPPNHRRALVNTGEWVAPSPSPPSSSSGWPSQPACFTQSDTEGQHIAPAAPPAAPSIGPPTSSIAGPGEVPPETPTVQQGAAEILAVPRLCPDRVAVPQLSSRPALEPLAPGRYKLQLTVGGDTKKRLERLQALMRGPRSIPDLTVIVEGAIAEKLKRLEARRFAQGRAAGKARFQDGADDSKTHPAAEPKTRHIPAAVRRAVYARDGGRCRYRDAQGRRCPESSRLEFHHRRPFGMGGGHAVKNLALLCAAHNRFMADQDYGRAGPPLTAHAPPGIESS